MASDEIRLHYHELVANTRHIQCAQLYQANLTVDKSMLDNLVRMAKVSPSAFQAVLTITAEMAQKGREEIGFEVIAVHRDMRLYKEILQTGNLHWHNILNGIAPIIKVDPPAQLSAQDSAIYTEKASK